ASSPHPPDGSKRNPPAKHPPRGRARRAVSVPPKAASVSRPFPCIPLYSTASARFFQGARRENARLARWQGGRSAAFLPHGADAIGALGAADVQLGLLVLVFGDQRGVEGAHLLAAGLVFLLGDGLVGQKL